MHVMIGTVPATLTDRDLVGVGGEANVYQWQGQAIKIYHPVDPSLPRKARQVASQHLAAKFAKVAAFPAGLPRELLAPTTLVTDTGTGEPVGFAMPLLQRAEEVRRLGQRSWRDGVVDNATVTRLYQRMHGVLDQLHRQAIVVGDLNDSNVLFSGTDPWFIDADSVQIGSLPCPVAQEWFLDPQLYGIDLTAQASFRPNTDWYAFSVMLFMSLMYVHPYGGVHPGHPTLLRRAEARYSILRSDVKAPKAAESWQILPDELLAWFEGVFDHDQRGRFPEALLNLAWTTCACGSTHARRHCPTCATSVPVPVKPATTVRGRCQATRIFATTGRILTATVQGSLKYAYEEAGTVRRETGAVVMKQAIQPGMRLAISGPSTWVGFRDRLLRIQQEQVLERTGCGQFGNEPVFDANATTCFRQDGDWLLNALAGTRSAQILEGQSWFRLGDRFGCGFYRTGQITVFFVFDGKRPGLTRVTLPPLDGRLLEASATFDQDAVLVQFLTAKEGSRSSLLAVIGSDGHVRAQCAGSPDSAPHLAVTGGKTLLGDRVLCPTDDGLLSLAIDPKAGTLTEANRFVDTEPFVTATDSLLPGPGGSVYVVTAKTITQLILMP